MTKKGTSQTVDMYEREDITRFPRNMPSTHTEMIVHFRELSIYNPRSEAKRQKLAHVRLSCNVVHQSLPSEEDSPRPRLLPLLAFRRGARGRVGEEHVGVGKQVHGQRLPL